MTTQTNQAAGALQMPQPLQVVAYRSLQPSGSHTYCNTPQFFDNAEPLCKVSDAQAYAAQLTTELETKLAADEKRVAELFAELCTDKP